MPKKYAKDDVQGWTDKEVASWLHSKGLIVCLPDFDSVTGFQLLSLTNDDLKNLPTLSGNDKKRKALKKALSQLPGNSVSKSKSKLASKSKNPPVPANPLPPSSFEPVPPAPPPPISHSTFYPPPSSHSTFYPPPSPHSPNSTTYSDPSLIFPGDEDHMQELYDNPDDVRGREQDGFNGMVPAPPLPPLPPPSHFPPQEEDDQMIYEEYDEEVMYDSSFASEEDEEEEGEEEMAAARVNGVGNAAPNTEANIRAVCGKFFAGGFTEHTGISTVTSHEQVESEEDDDLYDLPPEELRSHPPPLGLAASPPDYQPPEDEEEDEGDIYDIVEEVLQPPEEIQELYDTAPVESSPPPLPPSLPPKSMQEPPAPPRPPKPGPSPAVPRKELSVPSSPPQPSRPALASMRSPIHSTAVHFPPTKSALRPRLETPPPFPQSTSPNAVPAPPPPPPPVVSKMESTASSSTASSHKRDNPPPASTSPLSSTPHSHLFGGGRMLTTASDRRSTSPQPPSRPDTAGADERRFTASSAGRAGGAVIGRFVGKQGARLPGKLEEGGDEKNSKPPLSDKPMSVQDRIKMLKKPSTDGDNSDKGTPPKPPDDVSPLTGRRMRKRSSVSDLIKTYHSGSSGTSDGERCVSPEPRPSLPPKSAGIGSARSPQLKRRPIGQQDTAAPSLPERAGTKPDTSPLRQGPPWNRAPSEEKEKPVWQREEKQQRMEASGEKQDNQPSWKKAVEERKKAAEEREMQPSWKKAAEQRETQPSWKKAVEERETQPSWKKAAEERETQPSWKKAAEQRETQPSWKKAAEERETQPSWKKAAEQRETQPSWKKAAEERETQPSWKKAAEERETQPSWKKAAEERETQPSWKKAAEQRETQPSWKKAVEERETQASWKKAAEERETQPSWKKAAEERETQPSWKKAAEEKEPPQIHRRWKGKDEEAARGGPSWGQKEDIKPEPPQKKNESSSTIPQTPSERGCESPSMSRKPFVYKPYKPPRMDSGASITSPSVPEPEPLPPPEPPRDNRPKFTPRPFPSPPPSPAEQQPELPPRPAKFSKRPTPEAPHEVPQVSPPKVTQRHVEASPAAPELPRRPRPEPGGQRLPPRPPKSDGSPVGHTWYHANLKDRKIAESRLMRHSQDGTFIIRDSSKKVGEYSLSLLYHGAVKHLRIRLRADGQYVLGEEKPDELAFASVVELVNYHKTEPLVLRSGGEVTLRYECPQ